MRAIKRKRPKRRERSAPLAGVDLNALARRTRYVGSVEHKDAPSEAGWPRPRADASICNIAVSSDFRRLTAWLRNAIRNGHVGAPWEGEFPRYAWYRHGQTVYEARLLNRVSGEYKGYPLDRKEWPEFI